MYAYFALIKLRMPVGVFAALPYKEKAMTIAMIDHYLKEKQREEAKLRRR